LTRFEGFADRATLPSLFSLGLSGQSGSAHSGPPSKAVVSNLRMTASRRRRIKGLNPRAGSFSAIPESVACGDNIEVHPRRGFPGGWVVELRVGIGIEEGWI